jgi:hypothetical protein
VTAVVLGKVLGEPDRHAPHLAGQFDLFKGRLCLRLTAIMLLGKACAT